MLGGPPTPAVGFAVGLERMAMMLPASTPATGAGTATVYVAAFGENGARAGLSALEELRLAGIRAISDFRCSSLKSHLRQADRLGCRYTLIVGDDEVSKGIALLRNMETKVQHELSFHPLGRQVSTIIHAS
jgi:histidyl-tRNA synthetase